MTARSTALAARIAATAFVALVGLGALASCAAEPDAIHPTAPGPGPSVETKPAPTAEPEPEPTEQPAPPGFDKAALSLDDPNSIWVIVNKLRPLNPQNYIPTDLVTPNVHSTNGQPLRAVAAEATERMVAAAAADGVAIHIVSAYRSYDTQVSVYGNFVANQGQAFADTTSARPGHSEHQTGLTADFAGNDACTLDECFIDTAAGQWLNSRAAEFGFTMRYPNGLEGITGYHFEPWHYRYVGPELATELRAQGVNTLEEFFGLPAAGDYAG
ncbi:M15 family metallopeptidase [Leucobacter albus]|uniref:M15 family metallopeptidase n=1 Tax=Leucobacter albus TaxID=272210 RepID=A0ABW3TNV4_9MICO